MNIAQFIAGLSAQAQNTQQGAAHNPSGLASQSGAQSGVNNVHDFWTLLSGYISQSQAVTGAQNTIPGQGNGTTNGSGPVSVNLPENFDWAGFLNFALAQTGQGTDTANMQSLVHCGSDAGCIAADTTDQTQDIFSFQDTDAIMAFFDGLVEQKQDQDQTTALGWPANILAALNIIDSEGSVSGEERANDNGGTITVEITDQGEERTVNLQHLLTHGYAGTTTEDNEKFILIGQDILARLEQTIKQSAAGDSDETTLLNLIALQGSTPNTGNTPTSTTDQARTNTILPQKSNLFSHSPVPADSAPQDAIAARLNNLVVGGGESASTAGTAGTGVEGRNDAQGTPFDELVNLFARDQDTDSPRPLRRANPLLSETTQNGRTQTQDHIVLKKTSIPQTTENMAGNNSGSAIDTGSTVLTATEFSSTILPAAESYSPGSPAALTSNVINNPHATQPHPATQTVAATLHNMGQNPKNREITLQLDPPELGRVEVQMSFQKDKSVKTVMVIEKPETYMMLQRDSQTLQKALYDAGLDGDSSLSFELAQDNHNFAGDNKRGGGHDNGHFGVSGNDSGGQDGDSASIIQTTMTWNIDPDTGHTRYNFLI